jgi:hypothetical protein
VSSSVQRPRAWRYRSGVSRKSIVGTPASVHGSKALGVACLESMNWVRVTGAADRSIWVILEVARLIVWSDWPPCFGVESATESYSGCLQGQYFRVGERCGRRCMYRMSKPEGFLTTMCSMFDLSVWCCLFPSYSWVVFHRHTVEQSSNASQGKLLLSGKQCIWASNGWNVRHCPEPGPRTQKTPASEGKRPRL